MNWAVNFQHHIPKTDFVQQKSSLSITGIVFFQNVEPKCKVETTDSVSTMQKAGWTIHSSFLVLSGLERGFILDPITKGK